MSECSAKGTPAKVDNAVELPDLGTYFRRERGMSRRKAQFTAREVYRDESLSRRILPSGWHEAIYPPAVGYVRTARVLAEPFTPEQHAAWLKAGGDRA
ncbi:hypothetical protein [Arthrobacter rhombi]|uniref:Uncharacterized protein n=1 Tax=Arthrobacter rhombi TaxID=71253 RepID=A0A1R4G3P9_9MICC|nr:hypothetical protein [Arthrobacter rhombi]SJM62801.1 hypothetical protein FM101_07480 [Arthrobacter rhombi]